MTDPAPTTLPTYLEARRTALGLSKRAFALQLGISHAIYVKLTTHNRHTPLNQTLVAVAHGLDIPLVQVLTLAGVDLGIPASLLAVADDPAVLRLINRLLHLSPDQRAAKIDRWITKDQG